MPSAVLLWAELRERHDQIASSPHAHLRVTLTDSGGAPRGTRRQQLTGAFIIFGGILGPILGLLVALVISVYAGVPAPVASAVTDGLGAVFLLSLGEYFGIAEQGWRRARVLPLAWAELHRARHGGVVVYLSGYSARPRKQRHGDEVMRIWLAHADTHHIAVIADARNTALTRIYVERYRFQLVHGTQGRLLVRLPAYVGVVRVLGA